MSNYSDGSVQIVRRRVFNATAVRIETAKENNLNPYQYLMLLLEKLPSTTTGDLEALLPWGEGIPDYCKVPVKASNVKQEKPKYSSKKGPLHNALQKLRAKYAVIDSS